MPATPHDQAAAPTARSRSEHRYDLVIAANRLPVDRVVADDGTFSWGRSPGGLVTAMDSVMRSREGAWVGWAGEASDTAETPEPFAEAGMYLRPVPLSSEEVRDYYEGFSNDTLWPIYHDVIVQATFHREWWRSYVRVNQRFAEAIAEVAAEGASVWVQDYQLQLVPRMVRELRPDVRIGWFNHIPFPPVELFAQLPWRRGVLEGLLGADFLGFQRVADAQNFVRACRQLLRAPTRKDTVTFPGPDGAPHTTRAAAIPISIDFTGLERLARTPEVMARSRELRTQLGNPHVLMLGVDRLDYTKGIRHRLKAYEELLQDGTVAPPDVTLVQVATPSRERVDSYRDLRTQVERTVGRINGEYAPIGSPAVHYLHHTQPVEEMAALFLAADVMLVTPLRDGMNLVAKEYVTCRHDLGGALVLSEFTGAYHELHQAFVCNPHDIEGLKQTILRAIHTPDKDRRRIMRALRRRVSDHDVNRWASRFLDALATAPERPQQTKQQDDEDDIHRTARYAAEDQREDARRGLTRTRLARPMDPAVSREVSTAQGADASDLETSLRGLAGATTLLVASDFDGALAEFTTDPGATRPAPGAMTALRALSRLPGTTVAIVSGRDVGTLGELAGVDPADRIALLGSHGAESTVSGVGDGTIDDGQSALLDDLTTRVAELIEQHPGARLERKRAAVAVHTRGLPADSADAALAAAELLGQGQPDVRVLAGKSVVELSVSHADKGSALRALAGVVGAARIFYSGDDVTDEDAFRVLDPREDVSVKVGSGATSATHRVADVTGLVRTLQRLLELRRDDADEASPPEVAGAPAARRPPKVTIRPGPSGQR